MIAAIALAGHRSGTAPVMMLRRSGIFDERTLQPAFIPRENVRYAGASASLGRSAVQSPPR
jgi:hypothetical protein